jgi:hypothetical protein
LAAAGAFAVGGVVFHALALGKQGALNDANKANDPVAWMANSGAFETDRGLAIGLYAAAAITGAIGLVVKLRYHEYIQPTVSSSTTGTPMFGIAVMR